MEASETSRTGQSKPRFRKSTIPPRQTGDVTPLSFGQQRMWFIHQFDPQNPVYNAYRVWRLKGALNREALRKTFETIVARHGILRAGIQFRDGQACQVTHQATTFELPVVDLRECSSAAPDKVCDEKTQQEAQTPFDFSDGSLFRIKLFQLDLDDHVLLVCMHHIISDGWSLGILHKEMRVLYEAFQKGESSPLPDLSLQYGHYAVWQQETFQGHRLETLLNYWKPQLANLTPLALPTDRLRPPTQTFRGRRLGFPLGHSLTTKLKEVSRKERVTLFMTLLTCFKVLLFRYSNQEDIAVGTAIHNRMDREIESVIGMFVNTLVLRSDLSGNPSFRELLHRIRETCIGAYAHQEIPFDKLVDEIQPQQNLSRNPLFQVAFSYQNFPDQWLELPGLNVTPFGPSSVGPFQKENHTSKFDLTLTLVEFEGELQGMMEYSTDLFDHSSIQRMAKHYQNLIEGIVQDPDQGIQELPLLTLPERQQLLVDWNATTTDSPSAMCFPDLFEAQVATTPDAIALVFENQQVTYAGLHTKACHLALHLGQKQIRPEDTVGVCLPRGLEVVVAILGIWKAGGAYVPLDPTYPRDRLAYILDDANVKLVLTHTDLAHQLPPHDIPVICLDTVTSQPDKTTCQPLDRRVTPDSLAYVIYTSGSTGTPKGVLVPHRGLANIGVEQQRILGVGPHSRVLQFASSSFDASIFELVMALQAGGTLYMGTQDTLQPGKALLHFLRQHAITVVTLPPSVLATMPPEPLPALETITVAGETCTSAAVEQWGGERAFFNLYGPTEGTIWTTVAQCRVNGARRPPIGRPIAHTQVYVLDPTMQPVPIGVSGELHIGGTSLARGYFNRPDLTADKFVPHPFSGEPGARLYKTGDLARYRPDGNLEFLGRIDHQVKVRAYRIELGEIEAVLAQHPNVQEAVALMRENTQDDKRLVAYVVTTHDPAPAHEELRNFVKTQLPHYMVPSAFVLLDALPLTVNGKVNRRALPVPESSRAPLKTDFVAPRSPFEEIVAEIWRETLGLTQVGVHDNFFDLGGHSLMATKIMSRLKATNAVDMPLRALFDSPTVAEFSATLAKVRREEEPPVKTGLRPTPRTETIPLSFAQERFWLLDQFHTDRTVFNGPSGFRLRGCFHLKVFQESVQALVDRHEILRTTFANIEGQPQQIIAPTVALEVPFLNCSGLSQEAQDSVIQDAFLEERHLQFDLTHGPLFRARLLRFAEDDHFLVLNIHHIIHDAWSLEIILKDLVAAYTAGCTGHSVILPALPIQYADYAQWQRELVEGPVGQRQLAFWKTRLAQLPPPLPLPTDYARSSVQTFRGARVSHRLSPEVTEQLRTLNRQGGTTLFMVLLATLQFLLYRLTGMQDILVGAPVAGREQQELHGLIGCFLNTLVFRTDLSETLTARDLLKQVREGVLEAYDNQDVPFEKLLAELQPVRDPSRTPIFQVLLNMHSFEDRTLPLPGLSVTRHDSSHTKSLFDMTLYFTETAEDIQFRLVYNADLFSAARMTEFMQQFQLLLRQMIADPDQPLSHYTLCTPADQHLLPDPLLPLETPVQELVHAQVATWSVTTPGHAAVHQGRHTWDYAELTSRARMISQTLLSLGVKRGEVVAIIGSSSFGLVASLLGVLRSGGVFLLIDPALPMERQEVMVTEARATFQLTVSPTPFSSNRKGKDTFRTQLKIMSQTGDVIGPRSCLDPQKPIGEPLIGQTDPAYIFFTSGTTGTPKAILGTHQGLSHFLDWQRETFTISPHDRVAQLTGLSFDPILRDIFLPLTSGGVLCLPEEWDQASGGTILRWLEREKITVLHTVPTVAQYWLADAPPEIDLPKLRWVFFSGEPLTDRLIQLWRKTFPHTGQEVNLYGPTETTLAKACYQIPTEPQPGVQPIGSPLPQTQLFVMTLNSQLCGIGELGEIVIRTPFRTLGYLNADSKHTQSFRLNPFTHDESDVWYWTGDRGRYRLDGTIEIFGRRDDQVKIRGVRIEPGEVMSVLNRLPQIRASYVTGWKPEQADTILVAYVVPTQPGGITASDLHTAVSQTLPSALVPSRIVLLEALPRTPNGKVDRLALPAPEKSQGNFEKPFVEPRTPIEFAIAGIWQEVLKMDRAGIHDSFFELGGHSLLAFQVVSRIRTSYQVDLPLGKLFERPTIEGLAEEVETLLIQQLQDMPDEEAEQYLNRDGLKEHPGTGS